MDIASKFMSELQARVANNDVYLEYTDRALAQIIQEGSDPIYGARPLKRYIQANIETLVAYKMIEEDDLEDRTLVLDYVDEAYVVNLKDFN